MVEQKTENNPLLNPSKKVSLQEEEKVKLFVIKRTIMSILLYTFMVAFAIFVLIPFYWMIITSLKNSTEIEFRPPTLFPNDLFFRNYLIVFTDFPFGQFMLNTIIVGVSTTAITLFTTIFAAFAFARLNFKGKDLVFSILLSTMMVPGEMLIITNYITVSKWGWINTYPALILPFCASVFNIYYLRQAFRQIPNELYYASKVDGIGDFKYLFKVMIPNAKATLTTITILGIMGSWNAYVWPSLVTRASQDPAITDMRLITNGLMTSFSSESVSMLNLQMAATFIVTLPLLIVFIIFKKYIMRGVSRSGIKG